MSTTDGFAGVLRIASMLQQRGYAVHAFTADSPQGAVATTVTCTIAVTIDEADLLRQRLYRMPCVVSVTVPASVS